MGWTVETLNAAVDAEVNALPADMRAKLARISLLIEAFGLERVREPYVKHLLVPYVIDSAAKFRIDGSATE